MAEAATELERAIAENLRTLCLEGKGRREERREEEEIKEEVVLGGGVVEVIAWRARRDMTEERLAVARR